jgi:hypothetical protein
VLVDGNALGSGYTATVDDSRFTIEGSTLKLRASEFVRRSDQQEIQVVVTVQDVSSAFLPVVGTFVIEVLPNQNPFHNEQNPYDVNGDGQVNPLDALLVINSMSRNGGPGPITDFPSPDRFYDVNGDGMITALDALLIINFLNRKNRGEGEPVKPQGVAAPDVAPTGNIATGPSTQAPSTNSSPNVPGADSPSSFESVSNGEGEQVANPSPQDSFLASQELTRLRDDVLELLSDDALSAGDEVDAAIADFF